MPSTTRSSASSAIVIRASLPPGPDAEAAWILAPLGDLIEDGRGLRAPPAEWTEVRRGHLTRRGQEHPRELSPCLLGRREPLRHLPLAREQVVGDGAPRTVLLDQMGVGEHESAVAGDHGLVDVLLGSAGQVAQYRPRERPLARDRVDELRFQALRLVRL